MSNSLTHFPFTMGSSVNYNPVLHYHTHSQYEIYYFHGGKANYIINDRIYVLEPGDLFLLHGMTMHKAHVDPDTAYHRTTIHFDPYYFKKFIQPSYTPDLLIPFRKLHNVRLQLRGEEKLAMEARLSSMLKLYKEQTDYSLQRFQAQMLDLMIVIHELCQKPLQDIPEFPSAREEHVQRIISYIEQNFQEELTLELIQSELHLSKYYLAKTFKEITGMTIFYFLMQRRIYEAKLMLIEDDMPITNIGYEVGFKHPSHFSRAFKQHTNKTPEQYRKENKRVRSSNKSLPAERAIFESFPGHHTP
ncbi:helix-turn-helix transcriptional regulator [Paenibacillus sp. IITD108]|uniref:helix-turn-helix transcriptional regulator n=1 Tax=Paenibacillus sp. IITD108 TaxID=3116649 RepID=UPI002F414C08